VLHRKWILFLVLFFLLTSSIPVYSQSAPASPAVRILLEQHLDRVEARRGIDNLKEEQLELERQTLSLQTKLADQQLKMNKQQQQVGKVLRAYYAGERPSLWTVLLFADSWSEFFLIFDFLQIIYDRDRDTLNRYKQEVQITTDMKNDLDSLHGTIKQTIAHYESQVLRLDELNRQLDGRLSQLPDADKIRLLMEQLENDWLTKGLPAFEHYFKTISGSMRHLPEMIDLGQVDRSGSKIGVTLTDRQLNDHLVKKNRMFQNTRFTFKEDEMWIEGIHEGAALTVVGHYELVSSKEMQFRVNQLVYDGYQLPKSTQDQLISKFNLGFYPTYIHPNIRIDSMEMKEHTLQLVVKFTLGKK
jgi:hypothetical protein